MRFALVAMNPYRPGVGTRPPFLAGRDDQLRRFQRLLEDYPEKRGNLRITGLRGVGKTVLKEFERMAKHEGWVVVRRDLSSRLCDEGAFAAAMADYLRDAVDHGGYAYTAPLFGDFLRRRHPRLAEDT